MTYTLPDDFNFGPFDAQISDWIEEKLPFEVICSRVKERWPSLEPGMIQHSILLAQRRLILKAPRPINLDREMRRVYSKRLKRMKQVEAILDAGEAPLSMHTLYRGLLRDHESFCHKIQAQHRQTELDQRQFDKEARNLAETVMNRYEQKLRKLHDSQPTESANDESEETETAPQRAAASSNGFRSFSLLLGFILS